MTSIKSFKEVIKTLNTYFSAGKLSSPISPHTRRSLQQFVDDHNHKWSTEDSARASQELRSFYDNHVGTGQDRREAFMAVLKELCPILKAEQERWSWWKLLAKPIICSTTYRQSAQDDARDFLLCCMLKDSSKDGADDDKQERSRPSNRLRSDLIAIYVNSSRTLDEDTHADAPADAQVRNHVENVLLAFGRKQPKDLFHSIDELVVAADTRLHALTLLNSFLRLQTPHVYLVVNTPLVENLLKCLMNDLSTALLSAALTSLIMLMPHVPGALAQHLPRLFLIYSRLLCWEKFSPLSTEMERNLVTDDRISTGLETDAEPGDVGIDSTWIKVKPRDGIVEAKTPELLIYFTYLYGLYPLNFMCYIRKSRRYLKDVDFPGAEAFDLDQAVIRSRTEQFRSVHLLHPNFHLMTMEEELSDPKWPNADPADVVAECEGLCINHEFSIASVGPFDAKLSDMYHIPLPSDRGSVMSWRDNASTGTSGDSPKMAPQRDRSILKDEVHLDSLGAQSTSRHSLVSARPSTAQGSSTHEASQPTENSLAYLQRDNTLLRNELNFEKWHKAQYLVHIGQLMRKNVRDATAEAETLNLINANRALKKQLEQIRSAREATIKDSNLTRKRAENLEALMQERINKLKKEEETWRADATELKRLQAETGQYQSLLAAREAEVKNLENHAFVVRRELDEKRKLETELMETQLQLRKLEHRSFEFDCATRSVEILEKEKKQLRAAVEKHDVQCARLRKLYLDRIGDLESGLQRIQSAPGRSSNTQQDADQGVSNIEARFDALKQAHIRLLDIYTALELKALSSRQQQGDFRGRSRGVHHTWSTEENLSAQNMKQAVSIPGVHLSEYTFGFTSDDHESGAHSLPAVYNKVGSSSAAASNAITTPRTVLGATQANKTLPRRSSTPTIIFNRSAPMMASVKEQSSIAQLMSGIGDVAVQQTHEMAKHSPHTNVKQNTAGSAEQPGISIPAKKSAFRRFL